MTPAEGVWAFAFMRAGENHHELAVALSWDVSRLHHVAFAVPSISDLGRFADRLVRTGTRAEVGIVRHGPGGNASLYVKDLGGNRVELTADLARVVPGQPPRMWSGDLRSIFNVWTLEDVPQSFMQKS